MLDLLGQTRISGILGKHRVLIIGVGSIGERHARCFLTTERAEVGICEINDALRRTVADRYPVLGAFRQVEEALQQPFDAAVVAVSTLDDCVASIVRAVDGAGGTVIITADHGNVEQMWDAERNGPHTAHTTNPVPVLLIGPDVKAGMPLRDGSLCDVAPTMLGVLGIERPPQMTGCDLRRWLD